MLDLKFGPSSIQSMGRALVLAALLVAVATASLDAWQVLSPSSTPLKSDPQNANKGTSSNQNVEPSRRLVIAMDQQIPFNVIDGETEKEYVAAARSFLTGTMSETVALLDAIKEKNNEAPPSPLLLATMHYTAGNNVQGRLWLEKTASEYPKHPMSFITFARFSATEKRIADAAAMLEKVDRLMTESTWSDAQNKMFRIEYLDVLSDVSVNQQNLEKAKDCLLELQKVLPENARVLVRLAQVEFDLENVDSSLAYLKQAKEMSPGMGVPEVIMADWFRKKSDVATSKKWIKEASSLNPEDANVQLHYARWLLENEELQEALAVVTRAEALAGNSYVVNYLKGQISFARQAYDLAESHFEMLLREKPRDADATNMLALSLVESGEPEKMSRALELALLNQQIYPRSPTALATVGWIYYRNGKLNEAESIFRQILQTNSMEPAAAYFVAAYLERKGDFAGAKSLLDKAVVSNNYFMFRTAAKQLLDNVNSKLPENTDTDETPETGNDSSKTGDGD